MYDAADQFNLVRVGGAGPGGGTALMYAACRASRLRRMRWPAWRGLRAAAGLPCGTACSRCVCVLPSPSWRRFDPARPQYAIHIYSPLGLHFGSFTPASATFLGSDPGLGVRTVAWGPAGLWLGVGGWDGRARVLESDGWRCVATLSPGAKLSGGVTVGGVREMGVRMKSSDGASQAVWKEPGDWYRQTHGRGVVACESRLLPAGPMQSVVDLSIPGSRQGRGQPVRPKRPARPGKAEPQTGHHPARVERRRNVPTRAEWWVPSPHVASTVRT